MIKPIKKKFSVPIIIISMLIIIFSILFIVKPDKFREYFSLSHYNSIVETAKDKKYSNNYYYTNGIREYDRGNYEEAIEYLSEEIKEHDDNALAHYLLGKIYEEHVIKGDKYYDKMAKNYQKYIELRQPNGIYIKHAKLKVAQFYVKEWLEKKDEDKLKIAKEYLNTLDKSDNGVGMYLGAIYLNEKDYDKAIIAFESAGSLPLGELRIKYNSLGLAYIKKKMYKKAQRELEYAVFIDPKDKYAHNNLGFTYVQQEKLSEAKPHFIEALKIDPSYENAKRNLEWVEETLAKKEIKNKEGGR
jgi:tetratricopeptide (TPR) repeat protein